MIPGKPASLTAVLAAGTLAIAALALPPLVLPVRAQEIPLPRVKPLGFAASTPSQDITGAIVRAENVAPISGQLKDGLDALSDRDPVKALRIRNALQQDGLDRHILTWAIVTSGQKGVPSYEIANAQRELRGWPGLASLRANSERALARENAPPADVIAAFGTTQPETADGAIALARAKMASGGTAAAAVVLRPFWLREPLTKDMETTILEDFSGVLTVADHKARMEMLLYRGRADQAARFGDLGQAQSLYRAWAAAIRKAPNAGQLVKAVDPKWHKDPGYTFVRILLANRADRYVEAADLLVHAPDDAKALVNPGEWWTQRRITSRGLADLGKYKSAYTVVASHAAREQADVVDAEFHAGWYALRGLNDPSTAAKHFRNILQSSNRPLSVSRAWYWMGRAAEAGGPGSSSEYYTKAANFPGTFYGQLAAARIGRKTLNVTYPSPSPDERNRFESREAVKAIARLDAAGHGWRAAALYRALADELQSPGEMAILAAKAERQGDHQLSLQVGKIAFGRGMDVAALAFPVGVIPAGANISGSGKALAYAIARQESAFNPAAVSPANARGLLQLLPGTAQGVAKRYGIAYSKEKLTSDAGYNATLGAHYLGEQINDFGGSYILTFIAYNAGPKRVPQWIERYGDPRGKPIDEVVDWIERIPFTETRSYVQRVMENYQVYKTRLGQEADIVHDLRMGR
ncbi:lytic transglycosylase domain-containing protein [Sinorhizobium sp. BG8]|uniref:lytic transglycosylase domain-containing protein n=1 Tax=Sinorhizobium sp. BG8 TaxID=2613773 RepID=UPI00193EB0B5|nr:lytic transglycosylase domain-containing protein [Sinorhizobium sp. BG8]QRM54809.1 lytic transglycosylase domain-containing protein [Sinorhizobium sp. BG8]